MTKAELIKEWRQRAGTEAKYMRSFHGLSIAYKVREAKAMILLTCAAELEKLP